MQDFSILSNAQLAEVQKGLRADCLQARSEGKSDEAYSIAQVLRRATAEMQKRMLN